MSAKLNANCIVPILVIFLIILFLILLSFPIRFIRPDGLMCDFIMVTVGLLAVAIFRNVVGIITFDVLTPILWAFIFREVSLLVGIILLTVIFMTAWILRRISDDLKLLLIPKIALIISVVIGLLVFFLVSLEPFRNGERQSASLIFPFLVMLLAAERFVFLQMESGTKTACQAAVGTIIVAVAIYYLITAESSREFIQSFPEIIFLLIAFLLCLGRYGGLRVSELWRFRHLSPMENKK